MRRQAKTVNFGMIYGQSATGLAAAAGHRTGAPPPSSSTATSDSYPGIEGSWSGSWRSAASKGYVTYDPGPPAGDPTASAPNAGRSRNLAERTAVNTVIQGSAADLIKLAMIAIHRRLRRERLAARMLLQIHDELIFEVPAEELPQLAALVREEMAGAAALRVPLKVDLKAGPNWADAKELS